jgi:hypothetical protein
MTADWMRNLLLRERGVCLPLTTTRVEGCPDPKPGVFSSDRQRIVRHMSRNTFRIELVSQRSRGSCGSCGRVTEWMSVSILRKGKSGSCQAADEGCGEVEKSQMVVTWHRFPDEDIHDPGIFHGCFVHAPENLDAC